MTTTGTLTAEADEAATLQHDVFCILLNFHRQHGLRSIRSDVSEDEIRADSTVISRALGPRIGGRYVPVRDERAERNAAIVAMFNGTNRDQVLRHFGVSRRLFYRVIAEDIRRKQSGQKT